MSDDLRNIIAVAAMQEFLKYDLSMPIEDARGPDWVAKQSYLMADAMLEASNEDFTTKTA